jgi:hypothetical protein
MTMQNWNNGQLLTLQPGDTATCNGGLAGGQLYGLFFYNSTQNQASVDVTVVWSNSNPPKVVTVPGTTSNQGLASIMFVSGDDTNSVSATILPNQKGSLQCFIGSVAMPVNTAGINNMSLPADGEWHPFQAFNRWYTVLESHWYQCQIQSNINQFIFVQFQEQSALVNIVNQTADPTNTVYAVGSAESRSQYKINATSSQTMPWSLQGNGSQTVWINADSIQNSQSARISLTSLAAHYKAFGAR